MVIDEMERAERVCRAIGGDVEHWLAVVALADALTAYQQSDTRIFRAARDAGITVEQWRALVEGRA